MGTDTDWSPAEQWGQADQSANPRVVPERWSAGTVGSRDRRWLLDTAASAMGTEHDEALPLLRAVVETLAEMLTPVEARRAADRLPPDLAAYMCSGPRTQRTETLAREEMLARVGARSGMGEPPPLLEPRTGILLALLAQVTGVDQVAAIARTFLPQLVDESADAVEAEGGR